MTVKGAGFSAPGKVGPQGPAGVKGDMGSTGPTGVIGPQGAQGVKGDTGATGAQGIQGAKGDTGATGPAGTPAPTTGRLVLLGAINVTETLLVSLALGMKRKTFALAGVTATDTLLAIPTAAPTTGCEVVNAYPASAGNVSIGYYTPLLGIGATYAIPVSIFKVT